MKQNRTERNRFCAQTGTTRRGALSRTAHWRARDMSLAMRRFVAAGRTVQKLGAAGGAVRTVSDE